MAELKITTVEGIEQFQAEGDVAVVRELLAAWRDRNDRLRAEAKADYERMLGLTQAAGASGVALPPPMGPGGGAGGPVSPFRRRSS